MAHLPHALSILDPTAVLAVSSVLSVVSALMMLIQARFLREFRKPLLLMAASLGFATVSLAGTVFFFESTGPWRMPLTTLPGTLCYFFGAVSLIWFTRDRLPLRILVPLAMVALAGFALYPQAIESRHWNTVCQFGLACTVMAFGLSSRDREAPALRWLIVGLGALSAATVVAVLPQALAVLQAPGSGSPIVDGPAFRVRMLAWAVLPALLYAVVMALINGRLSARLKQAARVDSLTGVFNRRHLYSATADLFAVPNPQLAVVMIDIDHFKSINDRFGHLVGDKVLRETAQVIARSVRTYDAVVSRFGGEEFCLVLAHVDEARAMHIAQRVRKAVALAGIEHDGQTISVTVSIGVCQANRGQGLDDVLRFADARMYSAKAGGRNQVVGSAGQLAHV